MCGIVEYASSKQAAPILLDGLSKLEYWTYPLGDPWRSLQVFAYYMTLNRGCDVDKPRNLAKSVTVE